MAYPDFVDQELDRLDVILNPNLAVTIAVENIAKKRNTTTRYDPSKPRYQRSTLVEVNGSMPTNADLENFERKQKKSSEPKLPGENQGEEGVDSSGNEQDSVEKIDTKQLHKMIVRKSIKSRASANSNELAFDFNLTSDNLLLRRVLKNVDGEIFFDEASKKLLRISVNNAKSISVIPSVTLKLLIGEALFQTVEQIDHVVLAQTSYKVTGKKLFVSKIHEEVITRYYDYA